MMKGQLAPWQNPFGLLDSLRDQLCRLPPGFRRDATGPRQSVCWPRIAATYPRPVPQQS